jgi:hypothetical protein
MKKTINTVCLLLLLHEMSATAKTVEPEKAYRVALNFVAGYASADLRSAPSTLELVYTAVADAAPGLRAASATPLFYVYNVQDEGGFVMVSGDDCTVPVLAYADRGAFRTDAMPANLKNWLLFYEKEIARLIAKGGDAYAGFYADTRPSSPGLVLPTAEWNQDKPFNDLCPIDPESDERSLSGCVATAMGIVMKYHQWPEQGSGRYTYTTATHKIPLSVTFNVPYKWGNMPDVYTRSWNESQRNEVATLIYHCGVASEMDYTSEGSGTTEWDATHAMIKNFGYDPGMHMVYKPLYTNNEWNDLLQNELNQDRPILYGGVTKDDEGHLFILDGYDSRNFFHVNWGWGGYCNGYYLLSSLDPQADGAGGREGEGYVLEQDAIIGIQKATGQPYPDHEFFFIESKDFLFLGLSADVDTILKDKPFKLSYSYVYDYGERDFDGLMGFFVVDANGVSKAMIDTFSYSLPKHYALYDREGERYTITSEVEEGDKIRMYYKPYGRDWKPVRGASGAVTELPVGVPRPSANESPAKQAPSPLNVSVSADETAIHILSTGQTTLLAVRLFDLSGRLLKEANVSNETRLSLPAGDIPSGIYIVSVQTSQGRSEHKIVKP